MFTGRGAGRKTDEITQKRTKMEMFNSASNVNIHGGDFSNVGRDYNHNVHYSTTVYTSPGSSLTKFLELFPGIDCESKHTAVKSVVRTQPTAGSWLLMHEAYTTWKAGQSSTRLLWLKGIPGAGKTVLCSRVIDDLRKSQDQVAVLYFYCEYDVPSRHDSRTIFACLLHQIILSTPAHSPQLSQILNRYQLTRDIKDLPLADLILELSQLHEKTFIVIDGLDECSDLEIVLTELVILAEELRVFVSSRELAEIRAEFENYEQIKIGMDDVINDIRRFGTMEVGRIKVQNAKLRDTIVDKLIAGAQGSFLWSTFQVHRLQSAKSDSDVGHILATTPPDLQTAVVRALKALDSKKNSENLRLALQFIICAQRPITLQELAECVNVLEMTESRDSVFISMDPWCLIDSFTGLLTCVSAMEKGRYECYWPKDNSSNHLDDDNFIVIPVHNYVKDFLLADLMMLLPPLDKYLFHTSRPIQDSISKLRVASNHIFKHAGSSHLQPQDYPFAEFARHLKQREYDEIRTELSKSYLINEMETVGWLNKLLDRVWPLYEPYLSLNIVTAIDHVLRTDTPTFLDYMRLSTFTLGNKGPRIEGARILPNTELNGVVTMDLTVSLKSFDLANTTPEQAAVYVYPKIEFSIRMGKGLAIATMLIQAEDITFKGHIKLRLKLMSKFPHVEIVDFSLMGRPQLDFVLGGNTFGIDIVNIPALSSYFHEMIHRHLPAMSESPLISINFEEMLLQQDIDEAIGVVKVTLQSARGLKNLKIGGRPPDPYVSLNIGNCAEVARTKYKRRASNPTWMETKFVLVNNLEDYLLLDVYDYREHGEDVILGNAFFSLRTLQEDSAQPTITGCLLKNGKETGELKYGVSYYPVLTAEERDGRLTDTNTGIVRLIIHQGKDLYSHSCSHELNPMVKVYLGDGKAASYKSPIKRNTNNPVWEVAYEFLCLDKISFKIGVCVIDSRDSLKNAEIGHMVIRLTDLLTCSSEAGKDWFSLSNSNSGKIRISAEWKALNLDEPSVDTVRYTPPIGVVRLFLDQDINDIKNLHAALGGKGDPYVRALVSNIVKGRTDAITNDPYSAWDPIIYVPVHSLKETLLLEYTMDYKDSTKDHPLGFVEISVSELAKPSDNSQYPFEPTEATNRVDRIVIERDGFKAVVHCSAQFVPGMYIKGTTFKPRPNEFQDAYNGADSDARSISSGSSFEDKYWLTDLTIHMSDENVNLHENPFISAQSNSENTENASTNEEEERTEMNVEKLLTHQSGIIIFHVLSGQLNRKARLEVLLDDGYWPCFSTDKARSTQPQWNYIGEGFVKELDFSLVCFRLNEGTDDDKNGIIGILEQETKSFVTKALTGPQSFTLYDPKNNSKAVARVVIEARYVPVPVKLEPKESIYNQGILRVQLISGHDLHAADRSGKSDPFVVFTLNGQKVIRSQVRKRTLDPEWGEEFEIAIASRMQAQFSLEVFDWNQVKQSESLGTGLIDLVSLEPLLATDQAITLSSPKLGQIGQIRLNLLFTSKLINKHKKNTSTLTSAVRTMTNIGAFVGFWQQRASWQ